MAVIRIARISQSEAENLIGIMWGILEGRQIPSPTLSVTDLSDGSLDIRFVFRAAADAEAVRRSDNRFRLKLVVGEDVSSPGASP
jgi:hypothetical protein